MSSQRSNYISPAHFQYIQSRIPDLNLRKWNDEDVIFLFKIAYWCALRMNEALRLQKENFDLDRKEVYLGQTKTNKEDYAVIPKPFITELTQYLSKKPDGFLLEPVPTRDTVQKWITKLGHLCDIKAWTTPQSKTGEKTKMHIFRKSAGKDMIFGTHGKKAPLNVIMTQLRHKKLDSTTKYLKVENEAVKDFWE